MLFRLSHSLADDKRHPNAHNVGAAYHEIILLRRILERAKLVEASCIFNYPEDMAAFFDVEGLQRDIKAYEEAFKDVEP
jgi:hypothetical protein